MARMPPDPSPRPEFVEYRAQAAEFDVRASRFVGAVLSGHGDGLNPPGDVKALRDGLLSLPVETDTEAGEVDFYLESAFEAEDLLKEAARLNATPASR